MVFVRSDHTWTYYSIWLILWQKKEREKLLQIFSPENCYMQQINTCNGNSNPTKKNVHRAIFVRPWKYGFRTVFLTCFISKYRWKDQNMGASFSPPKIVKSIDRLSNQQHDFSSLRFQTYFFSSAGHKFHVPLMNHELWLFCKSDSNNILCGLLHCGSFIG